MSHYVAKTRFRFQQLISARQSGYNMTPERIWAVWKVQIETWHHEYWLLKLELEQIKRARGYHENQSQ